LDLGHRDIAMMAGITRDNDRASQRVEGVRQALAGAGLTLPGNRLVERPYSLTDARSGLRSLMATKPSPTAVVCGNDVLAFGAMLEAAATGLAMPGDLSIIGFDDLELARHLHPALTTVHVPTEKMWSIAADRLVASMRGEAVQRSTEIDVSLAVRQSTGPAPKKQEKRQVL